MLRITSHPVLSGLLLCLSFGTMSSFAAAQASVSADLSAPNFSSFSRNNNVVRWEQLVGLITAQGLSNPVANIASGTTLCTRAMALLQLTLPTARPPSLSKDWSSSVETPAAQTVP
jgi:hypothetical protein